MKIIKKLVSILIIIGFSLAQTACARCCVTTDLIKRIDDESKQPPKVVRYVDRIDKVISAYINDEEKELTICVEGKLAEKTTMQQFALKTSIDVEQLKNQPPKGIKYELKEGKIPTIQMERHTVIHSCPAQPTNTRTLMTANFNVDKDSLLGRKLNIFDLARTVEEKLASVYIKNNKQERDFMAKNPDKFQNIDLMEFARLLQPIQEKSDSVLYVSMDKPHSQYLTYTNYPPLVVQIGGGMSIAASKSIPKGSSPPPENQITYAYRQEPFRQVYNPAKFDEQHFVVFKIKEEEKIIPNTPRESYFAIPSAIIADILLIPSYLLTALLCPKYCRPM